MARIAGVDLPPKKRAEIGLTYIYGIGRTRVEVDPAPGGVEPDKKVADLSEEEVNRIRQIIEDEGAVEGDLRKEISMNIKRLIEMGSYRGSAAPPRPAGARPADAHQRAHPQGSAARHRGQQEEGGVEDLSRRRRGSHMAKAPAKAGKEEVLQEEGKEERPAWAWCTSRRRSTTRSSPSPTRSATWWPGRAPARSASADRARALRSPRSRRR